MEQAPGSGAAWLERFVVAAVVATWACAPTVASRQTDIMGKSGTITVTTAQMRTSVNALADRFADQIEQTADRIAGAAPARDVRRRALAFKLDAVPAVYAAAYRADPLTAVVDMWALAFQADHYFNDGAGRDAFGAWQGLARDGARQLLGEADLLSRRVTRPGEFDRVRADVEAWARSNPVRYTFSSRPPCTTFAADRRAEGRDAFVTLGEVSNTVENLSERLNTYAAQVPKLARWQAELLLFDSAGERGTAGALGDLQALGSAAQRFEGLAAGLPDLDSAGSQARSILAGERRAAFDALNVQRLQTLEFATSERVAFIAAVHDQRIASLAFLKQERIEALREVDAIKARGVDAAVAGLKEVVDYATWRLAALLLFVMVTAAFLVVVCYRLTIGRAQAKAAREPA